MTEQTKIPKMRVKLGEQNELKFMLSIKGSTSDPAATQPKIRFMITEAKTGMSVCFPMERLEEGTVGVTIPGLQGVFREGADYTGQVEVIVGNRWFNPTTVGLVFEKEMEVEAAPILTEETKVAVEDLQESAGLGEETEDEFSAVIKPTPKPVKKPSAVNEGALLDVLFSEENPKPKPSPKAPAIPQKAVAKPVDPSVAKMKNHLKSMISEAWSELEE
jgi:hypothetical protein